MQFHWLKWVALMGAFMTCSVASISYAQTVPTDPSVVLDVVGSGRQPSTSIKPLERLTCEVGDAGIDKVFAEHVGGSASFLINSFKLLDQEGVALDRKKFSYLYSKVEGYSGQKTDLRGLQAVAVGAQCSLRANGNLLSAIRVPPQTFERDGADVVLRVVLGRIVSVDYRYRGELLAGDLSSSGLTVAERRAISRVKVKFKRLTEPGPEADVDLERAVLLASRVHGVTVRPTLRRATNFGEGAVHLVVNIAEFQRYRADATLLNYSPKSLERWGPLLQVASNSQFVPGDQLLLSAYSSIDFKAQNVLRGAYEVPIMGSDVMFTLSGSYGRSRPGQDLALVDLKTESVVVGAELSYPVAVRPAFQANVYGGFEAVNQTLDIIGTEISNDRLSTLYAGVDGLFVWKNLLSTYDIGVRQGLSGVFGASKQGDVNLSRIGANPQAWMLKFKLDSDLKLVEKMHLRGRVSGQYSRDPLLAYEEFAVGNFTVGRGYEPGQLSGDSGLGGAFELVFGPSPANLASSGVLSDVQFQAFVFYDAVNVWNEDRFSEAQRFVDSQGLGVIVDITKNLSASITFAHANRKVFSFSSDEPGGSVLVRTTWKF